MPWDDLESRLEALLPRLRDLRQDLHRHPELGFEEVRTQRVVGEWLAEHGYSSRPCADTGLIAELTGSGAGPAVALRADLDALPIPERTELPYRSQNDGVAHKCGHDGHTAILCGVAAALAPLRGSLPLSVRFLFQPAEEGVRGGGARVMVAEGALEGVGEVYGLHNWPNFPRGEVRVAGGPVMAATHTLDLVLEGKGGHASQPQVCRDVITAGAAVVQALNTISAREIGTQGGAVLSVTSFQGGHTHNVLPGTVRLQGTLRTFSKDLRDRMVRRVREVVEGTCAAHGVLPRLQLDEDFPVLVNDPDRAAFVARCAAVELGEGKVSQEGLPLAAAEDFAYFTEQIPGAYFFLGAGRPGEETPGCHHPDFDFDDELIGPGVRVFCRIVREACAVRR